MQILFFWSYPDTTELHWSYSYIRFALCTSLLFAVLCDVQLQQDLGQPAGGGRRVRHASRSVADRADELRLPATEHIGCSRLARVLPKAVWSMWRQRLRIAPGWQGPLLCVGHLGERDTLHRSKTATVQARSHGAVQRAARGAGTSHAAARRAL